MAILQLDIVNVVISAWVDKLDIEKLARTLPKSMYEPDTFPGLIYHRHVPKATLIMFSTGRIVSTGAKSIKQGKESLNVTIQEINKIIKTELILQKIKTENIVAKGDIHNKINLKKLFKKCKNTRYNPDSFPAVIHIDKPNPSCLIFSTGKIISAGAKNELQARRSIRDMNIRIKESNCYL